MAAGGLGAGDGSASFEALRLRRAARLVHCLQKERGASCALCAYVSRPATAGSVVVVAASSLSTTSTSLLSSLKDALPRIPSPPPPPPLLDETNENGASNGIGGVGVGVGVGGNNRPEAAKAMLAPKPLPLSNGSERLLDGSRRVDIPNECVGVGVGRVGGATATGQRPNPSLSSLPPLPPPLSPTRPSSPPSVPAAARGQGALLPADHSSSLSSSFRQLQQQQQPPLPSDSDEEALSMLTESLRCARRNADAAVDLLISIDSSGFGRGGGRCSSGGKTCNEAIDLPVRESLVKIRRLVDAASTHAFASASARATSAAAAAGGGGGGVADSNNGPDNPLLSKAAATAAAAAAAAAAPGHATSNPSSVGFHRVLVAFKALVSSVTHVCIVQRCDALQQRARNGDLATALSAKKKNDVKKVHRKRSSPSKQGGAGVGVGVGAKASAVGIGAFLEAYDAEAKAAAAAGVGEMTADSKRTVGSSGSDSASVVTATSQPFYTNRPSSSLPTALDDCQPLPPSSAAMSMSMAMSMAMPPSPSAVAAGAPLPPSYQQYPMSPTPTPSPPKDLIASSHHSSRHHHHHHIPVPSRIARSSTLPVSPRGGGGGGFVGGYPPTPPRGRLPTMDAIPSEESVRGGGGGGGGGEPGPQGGGGAGIEMGRHHRKAGSDFVFSHENRGGGTGRGPGALLGRGGAAAPANPNRGRTFTGSGNAAYQAPSTPTPTSGSRGGDEQEHESTSSARASSLISLLLSFVRLKESTGVERAVLSSLMAMGGGVKRENKSWTDKRGGGSGGGGSRGGFDYASSRSSSNVSDSTSRFSRSSSTVSDVRNDLLVPSMLLFSDLVLEEENRRRIVRELRTQAWDATKHGFSTRRRDNRHGKGGALFDGGDHRVRGNGSFQIFKNGGGGGGGGGSGTGGGGMLGGGSKRFMDENYKSLLALVDQAVRPCPEMEHLHNTIRVDFDLEALQRAMSLEEFWGVITVYIDRLHALELLIMEELECCLATAEAAAAASRAAAVAAAVALPPRSDVVGHEPIPSPSVSPSYEEEEDDDDDGDDCSEEKKSMEGSRGRSEESLGRNASGSGGGKDLDDLVRVLFARSGNAEEVRQSNDEVVRALASVSSEHLKESLLRYLNLPVAASVVSGETLGVDDNKNNETSNGSASSSSSEASRNDGDAVAEPPLDPFAPPLAPANVNADADDDDDDGKEWEIDPYELEFRKRIGRGVAGTTYLAHWSGQKVAVKVAAITDMGLEGWNTEVKQLRRLHHPNIIRFMGSIHNPSPRTYGLVLEYCDAGDLNTSLGRWTPPSYFFRVAGDVANGMAYLHGRRILHRDIKPANILLHGDVSSGNFTAKLTDFGVATITQGHTDAEHTAETGTYRWMAPEVIRHESYSFKADVYSYALVVWQLITREEPFRKLSQIEAAGLVALEAARPPFPPGTPDPVVCFIERCWSESPNERQSFEEIKCELRGLKKVLSESDREWMDVSFGHPVYETPVSAPAAAPPAAGAGGKMRVRRSNSWHEGVDKHQQSESESSDNERGDHPHAKAVDKKKTSGWGFLVKKKKSRPFK